jgi:NAD(P)-dependent dehydrogenase (short-subunit alcohol dehydrogenase family)
MTAGSAPESARAAAAADELRGSPVVLTGVGRPGQVGEVVASAFAAKGATVILVDRDQGAVSERAADLGQEGATAHPFGCDLTDPKAVGALSEDIAALAPSGLAAVVHMAGGYVDGSPVSETDPAAWHKLFAINLTTAFNSTRAFLPLVRRARGSMVYFASAASLPGAAVKNMAAYAAAKSGVITLMRAVAAEERANGVRSNALAPQAIRTDQNLASMGKEHEYVERETVAAWVLWLCSRAAGPVTGQVIRLG